MTSIDFDRIAQTISPKQLAQAIGAKQDGKGDFHCPASGHKHGDRRASLSINRNNGRTLGFCHTCGINGSPIQLASEIWGTTVNVAAERLAAELGIVTPSSNGNTGLGGPTATYEYVDEQGDHLFEVVRFFPK